MMPKEANAKNETREVVNHYTLTHKFDQEYDLNNASTGNKY